MRNDGTMWRECKGLCGCRAVHLATYGPDADEHNPDPVWECLCCHRITPRVTRRRKTNPAVDRAWAELTGETK